MVVITPTQISENNIFKQTKKLKCKGEDSVRVKRMKASTKKTKQKKTDKQCATVSVLDKLTKVRTMCPYKATVKLD